MRPWMATILLTAAILVLDAGPAGACSCAPLAPQEQLDQADIVFVGELVDTVPALFGQRAVNHLRFDVDTVYKGDVASEAAVIEEVGCGLHADESTPYLVYAVPYAPYGETPTTSICTGTRPVDAGAIPRLLGQGRPPSADLALPREPDSFAGATPAPDGKGPLIAGIVAVAALALGAALVLRLRPAPR